MKYEMHVRVCKGEFPNHHCTDAGIHDMIEADDIQQAVHRAYPKAAALKRTGGYELVEYFLHDEQGKLIHEASV